MKLEDLKKQAAAILAIPDSIGDFKGVSFTCRSGGAPRNNIGVPEIHREQSFAYRTTANGDACSGEVVIMCRNTGAADKDNNSIFVTPEGVTFVFQYWHGSPSCFDHGELQSPSL